MVKETEQTVPCSSSSSGSSSSLTSSSSSSSSSSSTSGSSSSPTNSSGLSAGLEAAEYKAAYDRNAKFLVAEKCVLSRIMVGCIPEFKGMEPDETEKFIESTPAVGERAVIPGLTNKNVNESTKITGMDKESNIANEGTITYDVHFYVIHPHTKESIKIILNVEIEREYSLDIVPRGVFYGSRMISAQLGREFIVPHYRDIKKVYSIWLCVNTPKYAAGTMTEYKLKKYDIVGKFPAGRQKYDLLSVVTVCLANGMDEPKLIYDRELWLHRFIAVILSENLTVKEKKAILKKEYRVKMGEKMEGRCRDMCNLSEAIEERGIAIGKQVALVEVLQELGDIPENVTAKIYQEYSQNILKKWLKIAARAANISEFVKNME